MPQDPLTNRRFVLAERPAGEPTDRTLRLESSEIPKPASGQMLLRTEFLSLDPYMRGRMSDAPSYAPPVEIGAVMVGGTVARVVESELDGFSPGDRVLSFNGWQDYALSDGKGVTHLADDLEHPSWALGVLGMPGLTAWAGLKQIGQPKPGETLVVAAATGPVGATVGQIGKILGCRVVGVAGGPEKCRHAVETLGFDACIDHRDADFASKLIAATADGIDVYFENVGGKVFDAVIGQLNPASRVPVCGLVSQYNATGLPDGPDRMGWLMGQILRKRITMRGFIVFDDFGHLYPEFAREMTAWVATGKVHYTEEIIDGLENAPAAFIGLLRGESFGKRVIRLGHSNPDPSQDPMTTMKILMILTSHEQLGDTGKKTGFWLEEFAAPYYVLKDAGADITLASPQGGQPPLDPKSDEDDAQTDATRRFKQDSDAQKALASTLPLGEIDAAGFDGVFYPGGHGPLWDLAENADSKRLIEAFASSDRPIAAVCHAPAVFKNTLAADGKSLVSGRRVTGFTNTEEEAVGLTDVVPFLVEDMLKANGGLYQKGADWGSFVLVDGKLVTGQNPASSEEAASKLLELCRSDRQPG